MSSQRKILQEIKSVPLFKVLPADSKTSPAEAFKKLIAGDFPAYQAWLEKDKPLLKEQLQQLAGHLRQILSNLHSTTFDLSKLYVVIIKTANLFAEKTAQAKRSDLSDVNLINLTTHCFDSLLPLLENPFIRDRATPAALRLECILSALAARAQKTPTAQFHLSTTTLFALLIVAQQQKLFDIQQWSIACKAIGELAHGHHLTYETIKIDVIETALEAKTQPDSAAVSNALFGLGHLAADHHHQNKISIEAVHCWLSTLARGKFPAKQKKKLLGPALMGLRKLADNQGIKDRFLL